MYKRIILAYDGSVEGRSALREGALVARRCDAQVYLLSVVAETPGVRLAEGAAAGAVAQQQDYYKSVLKGGVDRLQQLGFKPHAKLVIGEPARVIGEYARQIKADLVVVGHRKQSLLQRWWSGSTGGYLVDHIPCSLLISRNPISDEMFVAELERMGAPIPVV